MKSNRYKLTLGALGIVYGDIGTSPLYAMSAAMGDLPATLLNVLGILSLIFWSLVIVISIKYMIFVLQADNQGEGGILALLALLRQKTGNRRLLYILAMFGAGLVLGDGMLTPAISVTSAMEGLLLITPNLKPVVLPLSCVILISLFLVQYRGSSKLGALFGPLIFLWFISIAMTGFLQLIENPTVLMAVNPWYGYAFLKHNGLHGYFLLGGVFLVVTGGEALYADLGHFGKNPIRRSWYLIALPCLLINYFGQGAHLIINPKAIVNPFFTMVPEWFYIPMLIIATLATVIASQAVISAAFSMTRQAILLGLYPKMPIIQTTDSHYGQIFIPQVNLFLMLGTLMLVITFHDSAGLAHAYGIAVNFNMLLVTLLVAIASLRVWRWPIAKTLLICTPFLLVDLSFLGANLHKFSTGGWLPLTFAIFVAIIMYTWDVGMRSLKRIYFTHGDEMKRMLKQLHYKSLHKIPEATSIFITDVYDMSGGSFLHFLKLIQTVPENILIVSYVVENVPKYDHRFEVIKMDEKIVQLILHYGFMEIISIPQALYTANDRNLLPFPIDVNKTAYFIDIPNIIASRRTRTLQFFWQEQLFAFLMRNYSAHLNIEFYQIPFNRTIGIGSYCML